MGSAASSKLPRDVQKQVDAHGRAGGVQHLVELLREISVGLPVILHLRQGLGFIPAVAVGVEVLKAVSSGNSVCSVCYVCAGAMR